MLAESKDRVNKERAMRRRQLEGLWKRLNGLQKMKLKRDELLKKLGAALHEYPVGARLIHTSVATGTAKLSFALRKDKVRQARKREGRYLLRSNINRGRTAEELWHFYIQLTEVEAAFKNLKGDLALRPIKDLEDAPVDSQALAQFNSSNPPSRASSQPSFANAARIASKFGNSFGVGVCSLY